MHIVETAFRKGYRVDRDGVSYGMKGGAIATTPDKHGYSRFTIRAGAKCRSVHVHQLQAYQKFGHEMFREGIQVRHLNGSPRDNSWGNIAIGTASDNAMDVPADIRHAKSLRAGCANSSLTVEKVQEARRLHAEGGWSSAGLAAKFEVARSTMSYIINRRTWVL